MYVSALNNTKLHIQHKQHTQKKRGKEINLKDKSALSDSATPSPPQKSLKDPINHSRLSACYISHTSRPPKKTRAQKMEATPGSLGDD
jgi:hypothetical protein